MMMMNDWPYTRDIPADDPATEEQRTALKLATTGRIGFLTGSPGSGKTFVAARLAKLIKSGDLALCAPTGRAAVRLQESMAAQKVDLPATTIHRLLGPQRNGHDGDGWSFQFNRWRRLPFKYYFMDESSMLTSGLAASFLAALPEKAHVLFIGDPHQLPPVGAGRPFVDVIGAQFPHGHLKSVHRYAGRIARVCQAIYAGESWSPSPAIDLKAESPENLRHVDAGSPMQQLAVMVEVISRLKDRGFDPISKVQVLVALNDSGPLSRKKVNAVLQNALNPKGEQVEKCPFRMGDKVVCLRNGYRCLHWEGPRDKDHPVDYVANGELGRVTQMGGGQVSSAWISVTFEGRSQAVRFDRPTWGSDIDLGYALSVHKAQGSGFPVVVTLADASGGARFVCSRAWWYTAISRASQLAITIGKRATIDLDCRKVDIDRRKTFLREDLLSLTGRVG